MKLLIIALTCLALSLPAMAYDIKVNSNVTSGKAYLTFYFGRDLHIEDSAVFSINGMAHFSNPKTLPGGIYAIVFPGKTKILEFLVDKGQTINIKADTNDLLKAVITGSPENKLFEAYQQFTNAKGSQMSAEREAYNRSKTRADSMLHDQNFRKYNKELNDYRNQVIEKNPKSMLASILRAMREPEANFSQAKTRQDSLEAFNEYRRHYWDGTDFLDGRLVRTPFFLPRLERYYRDVINFQPADTIIKDIDYKLLYSRTSPEMFKLLINWLTDEYINPKIMGQDAVFVHLFNNYHNKGMAPWLNEKQNETISRRAYMLMANLIGQPAADLKMLSSEGKPVSLYETEAKYTILVFWDPECGHCKEVTPKLDSLYQKHWKDKGVKIFGVLNEDRQADWKVFIKEKKLGDWIHAYQSKEMAKEIEDAKLPSYRQLFDVVSTPTIYLLDSEKKIIGKKLDWEQVHHLLESRMNAK